MPGRVVQCSECGVPLGHAVQNDSDAMVERVLVDPHLCEEGGT